MSLIQKVLTGLKNLVSQISYEITNLYLLFHGDLVRISLLIAIGLVLIKPDAPTIALVSYGFGLSFLLVAASHVLRKLLFRGVSMTDLAKEAFDNKNVAAALVFAAVSLTLIALMFIMAAPILR